MRQPRPEATLLGIPTEIRLYIYAYLCPDAPTSHIRCACHNTMRTDCELSASQQGKQPRGYLALLLSCRTIYNEAVDILYKPIIGTGCEAAKVSRFLVTAHQVSLAGFPAMFCRTHLTYRNGTAGLFQRIKKLHITIISCFEHSVSCSCCVEWFAGHDFEECPPPFGFDDKSLAIDNIRWLAEQLGRSDGFDYLSIELNWDYGEGFMSEGSPPELKDSRALLHPFKALRNVKELKIGGLGTWIEDAMEMGDVEGGMIDEWEEVIAYKMRMREILGSSAPVNENPVSLSTWLSFKQTVRRLNFFAPQVDAPKYLAQAAKAVRIQDKNAFQKTSTSLFNAWKEELQQRKRIASQFSELHQATYLDIPPGKRKEDDPKSVEFSEFTWGDPTIDKEDRAAYISFLESIDDM